MSKFNRAGATIVAPPPAPAGPIRTAATSTGVTHQGGTGFGRDPFSELFLLAVTNMVGENTFYEKAGQRDARFEELVARVAVEDPQWMAGFLGWLRGEGNMRSASQVAAAVAVHAQLAAGVTGGRRMVASVLQRADEPGELLAYWARTYGRSIPKSVKRGVADAVARLYSERSLLKYDTASHAYRFGDVLDLVHAAPAPDRPWQGALFQHALDRRHGRDTETPETLRMVRANTALRAAAAADPAALLNAEAVAAAGMTWEDVLSLAGDRVPKAALWEAVIGSMGYMALIRNLRGFDDAGVSNAAAAAVAARIADPGEVARSRQLPMRFLSAYRAAAASLRWSWPLEQALGHSLANIPKLPGRTLVLVDTSGSMNAGFSKDGTLMRWDAAVLFGLAVAARAEAADVVSFSNSTRVFPIKTGESVLVGINRWKSDGFFLNGGTDTAAAVNRFFAGHDRLVILTDEQAAYAGAHGVAAAVPATVPVYTWNLAGYQLGHTAGGPNRHTFGGLSDASFRIMNLLESGENGSWPWPN
jgi:hypothetical protein